MPSCLVDVEAVFHPGAGQPPGLLPGLLAAGGVEARDDEVLQGRPQVGEVPLLARPRQRARHPRAARPQLRPQVARTGAAAGLGQVSRETGDMKVSRYIF